MSNPTADQLGRVTDPAAHSSSVTPAAVDQTRDDDPRAVNYSPREARSWRAATYGAPAPGPATEGPQQPAHSTTGNADPRGVWGGTAGHTGATVDSLRPSPEVLYNGVRDESVNTQPLIDRPRAGSTGADPARPSRMPSWLFLRPFDQWAQYGPAALDKIEQPSPVASRPLHFAGSVPDALPSPFGSGPTTTEGIGGDANTVRLLPQPWDTEVVTPNADPNDGYATRARARGWALR